MTRTHFLISFLTAAALLLTGAQASALPTPHSPLPTPHSPLPTPRPAPAEDSLFIYLPEGRLDVYPAELIQSQEETDAALTVTTIDGKAHAYPQARIDSVRSRGPQDKPYFTSFKFNNKYNGQVYTDVQCEIGPDGLITGTVGAIGKWLTPSFQLSDKTAKVYVGKVVQRSKESRLSFAEPVDYVIARPGWQVMTLTSETVTPDDPDEPDPDEPDEPEDYDLVSGAVKLNLTADMLSTNAPTMIEREGLASILDGNESTYFHSTWSGAGYPTLPLDSCPWIEVTLPEAIHHLQFRYETRAADQRWPTAFRIDVSADGQTWHAVRTFTSENDGMPRSSLTWWTSPSFDLGGDYGHIRFVMTACDYKNYLCLAELELYKTPGGLFNNKKLYTIDCRRGGLVMNADGTGLAAGQRRTDTPEADTRFAILHINGAYYLYSPVVKKFLHYGGYFVSQLGSPITFDDSLADGEYTYMMTTTDETGKVLYFNNSGSNIVINSWDRPDEGNRWLITEVADFDPTEALKIAGVGGGGDDDGGDDPQPGEQKLEFMPYGTPYTVSIDWPTDRAVSVPTVYITTDIGRRPYDKVTFLDGSITIDGAGVFPDMAETRMQIRGRGNSSWAGEYGKSPYRIKFSEKQKPFGLTKGKNWVLLANSIGGSMMTNAIGMKVATQVGTAGANHIVPVELYINGEYRGSYNFTEKVGLANNSIDLDDETQAALLELDSYYDETYRFRSSYYLPVNIKKPEFDEEGSTVLTMEDIQQDFNQMEYAAYNLGDISNYVDPDTFATFYMTNEFIMNLELMHPKSTYLYKERVGDPDCKWKFGPVWDLDWGFGHELNGGYYTTGAVGDYTTVKSSMANCNFWRQMRAGGTAVDRAMYKVWTRYMRHNGLQELLDFCDDYLAYANSSFQHNGSYDYETRTTQAKNWLTQRAEYIYNKLTPYDLSDELPEEEIWKPYTDTDEPVTVDASTYIHVRNAIQQLLADDASYTCDATSKNPVERAILEQNQVIQKATTEAEVQTAVSTLRAAFTTFLADESLTIVQPIDITEVFITNSAPVENADGWTCSVQPNAFDPETHTAEFFRQAGASMQQTVSLPAGLYEWRATAMTRRGYTSHLFAGNETQQLATADKSEVDLREQARAWFDQGNGANALAFELTEENTAIALGLRADQDNGDHWTVWSDFTLVLTGKKSEPQVVVTDEQYERALQNINPDLHYRIFTRHNGTGWTDTKYYLTRGGHLTDKEEQAGDFQFIITVGNNLYRNPGWQLDAYFTNPTLSDGAWGDLVPRGYISVNRDARPDWEGQVWYQEGEFYAVRATNADSEEWGARTFWTAEDANADGYPEAGYSWEPYFYWQLEENPLVGVNDLNANDDLGGTADLSAAPVYDLAGRKVADRLDHFLRQRHATGIYVVAGRKLRL